MDHVQATASLEALLATNPRDGAAWSMLGHLLRRAGKLNGAIACHRRGLEFAPENASIWSNLGNALVEAGRFDEALAAHGEALRLEPHTPTFLFNNAVALRKAGRFKETLAMIARAAAEGAATPELRWERALARLQIGDYVHGFSDYEARRGLAAYHGRPPSERDWNGGPLDGRTLYLFTEQGFGDAILAARYMPLVRERGGRVLYDCHPELRRVLSGLGVDAVLQPGDAPPAFDVEASQMSLPGLFGTTLASVPPPVTLTVPDSSRTKAAHRLGAREPGTLRVGIVWSGRVTFGDNGRRATSLARFLRFAEVPGVRLYSLQKGPPEAELADSGVAGHLVTPLGPDLEDFADTAAMLEQLDLVIMTDSSVAHLAGSLGKPVWNLVQHVPYWIYGFSGDRTPWYPTMRLFRQGPDQDWEPVFARAADALREEVRRITGR
ncbi:tetratricopeptide repeat protein (plasmid) [Azospirillum argentinense]|uniref:Tetratricopeptide repeat protein n=1 Tax=Azospirillum argentinense TaxID=2970906 RepID=A0A4D8PPT9_9PROT|nr:tetratricopeptide repeat protein [Azospirillum argentinense]QCN97758.1 tetratricopeptide repeat protein [Azospirillum argentinense]